MGKHYVNVGNLYDIVRLNSEMFNTCFNRKKYIINLRNILLVVMMQKIKARESTPSENVLDFNIKNAAYSIVGKPYVHGTPAIKMQSSC